MALRLHMDVHIPGAITSSLRERGVDVLRAQDDGADELDDPDFLDRALSQGGVLFTYDDDLLAEAARRLAWGRPFGGIVYTEATRLSIGAAVRDLELLATVLEPEEMRDRVLFLPL